MFRSAAIVCCSIMIILASMSSANASDVRGARYPALSPDGTTVVFEYWGDLWSMPLDGSSCARRLTDHLAWDWLPRFSPDGTQIAFNSDRSGNQDIWVIPAAGGTARQITTFSGEDTLSGWSPDGKQLVFHSKRGLWANDLYRVDVLGQVLPEMLTANDHYHSIDGILSLDGSITFARGTGRWWRKGYRGTAQYDLWQLQADGDYAQLTSHSGKDIWPMLSADQERIYYVCDEDGIDNLWCLEPAIEERQQLTRFETDGVQWPSISSANDTIVFEHDGWLYQFSSALGQPEKVYVTINSESKGDFIVKQSFNDEVEEHDVSPNGKYVVIAHGGDLWAVKDPDAYGEDDKPDQDLSLAWRLTASDNARERNPVIAPDNRHLAYVSDADGDYEIYVMDLLDMSSRQVTDNDVNDLQPRFDPSTDTVLFYYSDNTTLMRQDLETTKTNVVADGRFRGSFGHYGYSVSPDGAWVAYVEELNDWSAEIFIVDSAGELTPVNITRHPDSEDTPRWSADGRRLIFHGNRNDESAIYIVDLDPEPDIYDLTFLFENDPSASSKEDDDDNDDEDSEDDVDGDDEKSDDREPVVVDIDFEDIHLRTRRITNHEGATRAIISNDGEWVVYSCVPNGAVREIWAVKADGSNEHKLLDGNWDNPEFTKNGKRLYYCNDGIVKYEKFKDGRSKESERIHIKGEFWLDKRERWQQMFQEGWRTLGERFYDQEMHGVDWSAVYVKYQPYIDTLTTPEEFKLVFEELLGELNASHLGIHMSEKSYDGPTVTAAHLGLEFTTDHSGPGLKINHVTYNGPADKPGMDINEGDIVMAISSEPVDGSMRLYELLNDTAGKPMQLEVVSATDGRTHEVMLKPISYAAYQSLLYREWELANEAWVSKMSGGQLGYIHIRSMSRSELRKFEREFFSECFDKAALIVDVRFNPGGFIHEDLFELLDRNPFGFAGHRDAPDTMQPARAFLKPKALLINARSGSDAEIFPSGWRSLGLGPVIGIDTAGAVIGTGGFRLVDGSWVRLPMEGWWALDRRNLELSGTPPDIYVDVNPQELLAGHDAQLETAVAVLLEMLDLNPVH